MTLYQRYINGETEQVYQDIFDLGTNAFLEENFAEIDKVLSETFTRVSFNLDVIYNKLSF